MKITPIAVLALTSRSFLRGATLSLILFFSHTNGIAAGGISRTLQSFGVTVQYGQPIYPLPSNVALGLFNPDPLLDVACYADGKIQVWQNLGNGTFGSEPVYEQRVSGEVVKMEWRKSRMFDTYTYDQNSWGDLLIAYADGHEEKVLHEQMMPKHAFSFSFTPSTIGVPPLNFREVWRSPPRNFPFSQVAVGDIDNDGKIEVAYWEITDTTRRFVVYENIGNDTYVLDWDTLFHDNLGGGVYGISDIDNDGHKEYDLVKNGVQFLECYGPGRYRLYSSNLTLFVPGEIFKMLETDVDHNGIKEICMQKHYIDGTHDETLIAIGEFVGKGPGQNGWSMAFNVQLARYDAYTFDMAIGQVDGTGYDEIIPAGGAFGFHGPVPIDYLWYSGIPGPTLWKVRQIHTGLESGTAAPMFVNLDSDTVKEFVNGGVGPIGHGSMFALKYLHDTTWSVLWVDSSLVTTPQRVASGILNGNFVVAGANKWESGALDSLYGELHIYKPQGTKVGVWRKDSVIIWQFYLLDIDNDGRTNLVYAQSSFRPPHYIMDFETDSGTTDVMPKQISNEFSLTQNFPNPFNPNTTIKFFLPKREKVSLNVYDILGRLVVTLMDELKDAGSYSLKWDAKAEASGIYFYRFETSAGSITKKMLLLR